MTPDEAKKKMNQMLFANLVAMLGSSALQQLGKLVNPMTKKTEVSLDGAQITIDMLEMIAEKTKNNLDPEENRMLQGLLTDLRMNYVETSEALAKQKPADKPGDARETPAAEPGSSGDAAAKPEAGKGANSEEPRFHKSYS